jgi:hypothetical protein
MAFTGLFKVLAEREKRKARSAEELRRAGDERLGGMELEDVEEK